MAEITMIQSRRKPKEVEPSRDVVGVCEELLRNAQNGTLEAICGIAYYAGNETTPDFVHAGDYDPWSMRGLLSHLAASLTFDTEEED